MAFQGVLAVLLVLIVVFMVISAVVNVSGILGIVFGCISAEKSGKYVTMRGNTDFKQVKNYSATSKVFFIINCIIMGLAAVLMIFMIFEFSIQDFEYGSNYTEYEDISVSNLITNFLYSSAAPIGSIIAGGIAVKKFKEAAALKEELDSKGLKSYPLPQNPYYNTYYSTVQMYQTPYQNQYGNAYQNQYYNGQYPNQYQNQYMQGGNQPDAGAQVNFTTAKIKCPNCGTENNGNNRFCVNCGNALK